MPLRLVRHLLALVVRLNTEAHAWLIEGTEHLGSDLEEQGMSLSDLLEVLGLLLLGEGQLPRAQCGFLVIHGSTLQ